MNTTLLLNQTSKEMERAKMQVAVDAKAAQLAHELARAAKVNLKQARKLSKMAKKLARKAEDRAEESSATLETAQAKLEMLRERIRNERRKNNPSPKSKPGKTTMDTTPRVSPVQSLRSTKPVARKADGARRSAQKTVNGKPANPAPTVAPEPKPVPAARQKLGGLNPLPAPDVVAPSFSGQVPTDD
jgi:hypothetical protein